MSCRPLLPLACLLALAASAPAQTLSRKADIDFFRDVPSRNLKGLATRSDGRLVGGPALAEHSSVAPADMLWALEPTPDPSKWLLGTGPDGRIVELTFDSGWAGYTIRDVVKLDDPQIFAVKRMPDGSILAGTSPKGALVLLREDQPVARAQLPVDSIFDLVLLDDGNVLAATGNPGRIYRIDLKKFSGSGLGTERITDADALAAIGITLFGEIRDRNVRRLAILSDGSVIAGSSPRGNVYRFQREGGAPIILQENRDAEVTDLLAGPDGDFHATIVFSPTSGETRITPPPAAAKGGAPAPRDETPPPAQVERFGGRSALIWFPADGFPETVAARANTALYRMARHVDLLLMAGGEQGELLGYDVKARLSLTFAGSLSSQLNAIAPVAGAPGKFLVLRNNAPGIAVLDFSATSPREAETRRIDLGTPAQLGALRFNRIRNLSPAALRLEVRLSNGTDEVEGWGPWSPLAADPDDGWRAGGLRGRHVRVRLTIADTAPPQIEIDRAALHLLPQNRRPQLQDFRVLTPGFAVIPAAEPPPSPTVPLSRLLEAPKEPERRGGGLLNSPVIPSPGAQLVMWNLTDPDGDNVEATFSIRREDQVDWIDLVASTRDTYAQFDTSSLPDGVYFTRLVATETAPRPPEERLSQTFETDDLIIDRTPPEILEANARRTADTVVITLRGRDRLSLLQGIEAVFNNGVRERVEQPADGIRDGREETFTLELPLPRVSNATAVEVTLYDAAGNGSTRRLAW